VSWRPSTSAEREARGRKQAEEELSRWQSIEAAREAERASEYRAGPVRVDYDRLRDLQTESFWRDSEREAERPYDHEWRTEVG
jgi:hypothetical protein